MSRMNYFENEYVESLHVCHYPLQICQILIAILFYLLLKHFFNFRNEYQNIAVF
jgi:hypothetical protein